MAAVEISSVDERLAIAGRRGWLFGLGEDERGQLGGTGAEVDPAPLAELVDALELTARALDELQVRYVPAVMPSKLAVHREQAPPRLARHADKRPHAASLMRLARDRDHLDLLDLLPALRDAVEHGALFHPRDDGLNARGAFFAHRALLKHAGIHRLKPLSVDRAAFARTRVPVPAGLTELPVVAFVDGELVPHEPKKLGAGRLEEADAATLESVRMPAGAHLEIEGLEAPRVYEHEGAAGTPRVMLMGDPVVHALTPWIAETTSRLVVLSTPAAPLEQIELEMPAVVLHVLDELLLAS